MTVRRTVARAAVPLIAAVLAAVLVVAGHLGWQAHRPDERVGHSEATAGYAEAAVERPAAMAGHPDGVSGPSAAGARAATTEPTGNPFGTPEPPLSGEPTRLKVPSIGVDTGLETLRVGATGELTPPADFARAGWFADGTVPGDVGPAVIAGHVDSRRGPAVFHRLRELDTGDVIEVIRGGVTVRFTVTSAAGYPKRAFPTEKVYGPTPDRQIRLITCGGMFDRSRKSYQDNLVIYAVRQ